MHTFTMDTAVFFNLFAAAEPSANVCVARGTLCNDPSVYIATTAKNCGCKFPPNKFGLFRRNPWQPIAGTWGSAEPRLKNIGIQWSNRECRPSVWSAAAESFNEICKVIARLRALLQITSAKQQAPIHFILPHLKLNRTGDSTHWRRKYKTRTIRSTKTDSLQGYDAAKTSNQKQHGAHLHDYVHPQAQAILRVLPFVTRGWPPHTDSIPGCFIRPQMHIHTWKLE